MRAWGDRSIISSRKQKRQASGTVYADNVYKLKWRSDLERYSDKYRPSATSQPTLKRKELHAPFFPNEVFEDYFNPKRKKKVAPVQPNTTGKIKMNIDELAEEGEDEVIFCACNVRRPLT